MRNGEDLDRRTRTYLLAAIIVMACLLRAPITSVSPVLSLIRTDVEMGSAVLGLLTTIRLSCLRSCPRLPARSARGWARGGRCC